MTTNRNQSQWEGMRFPCSDHQQTLKFVFLWSADYNCWEKKRNEKSQFEFHKHHPDLVTVLNSFPLGGERTIILHSQHETRIRYAKNGNYPAQDSNLQSQPGQQIIVVCYYLNACDTFIFPRKSLHLPGADVP